MLKPLFIFVAFILAISSIGASKPQPAWSITTVDSVGDVGRFPSIALDSSGNPRIAYHDFFSALKYATWDGSSWQLETVVSGGLGNSLVIDQNGNAHISTVNLGGSGLTYCHWDGSSWHTEIIVSQAGIMYGTSLALNSLGEPSISYVRKAAGDSGLRLISWNGSGWQKENICEGDVGWYTSLVFDALDRPRISFSDIGDINYNGELRYASFDGSSWQIETIDTVVSAGVGVDITMKLDSSGAPHIVYNSYSGTTDHLKYAWFKQANARFKQGEWIIQVVDQTSDTLVASSFDLDGKDRPHVSYIDATMGLVKYAYLKGKKWRTETVDSMEANVNVYTCLVLDTSGNPHIAYHERPNRDLKYASK